MSDDQIELSIGSRQGMKQMKGDLEEMSGRGLQKEDWTDRDQWNTGLT